MNDYRSTLQRTSSTLLIALVCWALPLPSWAQEDEIIAGGKIKYQQYCATCHGTTGKGDGKMASLLVFKPTNLTHLSKQNKGEFPFWRVYRAIDGRDFVRGHGSREMPLWGFVFQVEEGANDTSVQFDLVRGRIWQLVYFLESIQEKEPVASQ
jgi:mono/diheme cytochrome c family protein